MTDIHQLSIFCRVCGRRHTRAKRKEPVHDCQKHKQLLLLTFDIDVEEDRQDVHPTAFCNSCYATAARVKAAREKNTPYAHSTVLFEWNPHSENNCKV